MQTESGLQIISIHNKTAFSRGYEKSKKTKKLVIRQINQSNTSEWRARKKKFMTNQQGSVFAAIVRIGNIGPMPVESNLQGDLSKRGVR